MKHNIIKTENYLLVVDDSKIKEMDWVYDVYDESPKYITPVIILPLPNNFKKIIAHLPLNNSPILEGVDLLPPLEDDVEKLAEEEYREFPHSPKDKTDWHYNRDVHCFKKRKAFIKGYNKAKETLYTREQVIAIIEKLGSLIIK
jgi:hypothetical protein